MFNGWLVLDKPLELTSTKVGSLVKKLFHVKKLGHIGTLDPLATGVLILALGEATKLIPFWERWAPAIKSYDFSVQFGQETDTFDQEGKVVSTCDHLPSKNEVTQVCSSFLGEQEQVPPAYSALKWNGRRLCDWTRQGQELDINLIKKREIRIDTFTCRQIQTDGKGHVFSADFSVTCSGGTYIRSLAVDLAKRLNSLGFVTKLRRTQDRLFTEDDALSLDHIRNIAADESEPLALQRLLIPLEKVLALPSSDFGISTLFSPPILHLSDEELFKIQHGQPVVYDHASPSFSSFIQLFHQNRLIGIGKIKDDGLCWPEKLICYT